MAKQISIATARKTIDVESLLIDEVEMWENAFGYDSAELQISTEIKFLNGKIVTSRSRREYTLILDGEPSEITYSFYKTTDGIELSPTHWYE